MKFQKCKYHLASKEIAIVICPEHWQKGHNI